MRKFKLINSSGAEFDLMDKTAFFQSASGLGLQRNIDSVQAGYDFIETDNELDQHTVSGEIAFGDYERYADFVRFCAKSPLVFCYQPINRWYFINCTISKLEKGEIQSARLVCLVDFLCYSTWYDKVSVNKTKVDTSVGKTYSYAYPYIYAETSAGSVEIINTGDIPSPCKLHIKGAVVNPSWALIKDGKTILTGKVNATVPYGHKIIVDSSPASIEIAEYTNNNVFVSNLYQNSDFATARFLTIPTGNCKVTFMHEGAGIIDAFVEVKQLAETV